MTPRGRLLLLYLALAALLLGPLAVNGASRLPDDGDAPQGLWIMWWGAQHLFSPTTLLEANAYYPHPRGLLYSESMLAEALLGWPLFRIFSDNPVLAVNLLTWLTLSLSGWLCHLLYRELAADDGAAWLGVAFCVFNAYTFVQLPRLQLVTLQWLFLALLALHRAFMGGARRASVLFAVAVLLQGLACLYYAVFLALALVVLLPVYVATTRNLRALRNVLLAGSAAAALLAPLAWQYVTLYERYGFSGEAQGHDLASYFVPAARTLLYPDLAGAETDNHFLALGSLALAIAGAAGLVRAGHVRAPLAGYLGLGVLAFLLSGGAELSWRGEALAPGPFAVLAKLPVFGSLRIPGRLSVLVVIALGALVAFGAALVLPRQPRHRRIAGALVGLLLLAEQWPPLALTGEPIPTGSAVPAAYRWLSAQAGREPIAELPVRPWRFVRFTTLDAYFSSYHGSPILFAKASFYPPATEYLSWRLREFPDDDSQTVLRALGVRRVLLHPKRWAERQRFRLKRLERQGPEMRLDAAFGDVADSLSARYGLGGERVFALAPLEKEGIPRECACSEVDPRSIRASASGLGRARWTLDRDRSTAWSSGLRAEEHSPLELSLARPLRLVRVELELVHPYGAFPRDLVIEAGLAGQWSRLSIRPDVWADIQLIRQLVSDPTKARLRYDVEPTLADHLRLIPGVPEPGLPGWVVPEVHLFYEEPAEP